MPLLLIEDRLRTSTIVLKISWSEHLSGIAYTPWNRARHLCALEDLSEMVASLGFTKRSGGANFVL